MERIAMTEKVYRASKHMFDATEVSKMFGMVFMTVDVCNMYKVNELYKDYYWFGYANAWVSENQKD